MPPIIARYCTLAPRGHTFSMKTAVSIPDDVFEKAERFAKRAKRARSEVFAAALREYVSRHSPDEVTDAMDRVCSESGRSARRIRECGRQTPAE